MVIVGMLCGCLLNQATGPALLDEVVIESIQRIGM
jgi:hypothetical protein